MGEDERVCQTRMDEGQSGGFIESHACTGENAGHSHPLEAEPGLFRFGGTRREGRPKKEKKKKKKEKKKKKTVRWLDEGRNE